MKRRKQKTQLDQERRNVLYNKTIRHNMELSQKNTELSHTIDYWKTKYKSLEKFVNRKRWWQFWRYITQVSFVLNEAEAEAFDTNLRFITITYFYGIPIWKKATEY